MGGDAIGSGATASRSKPTQMQLSDPCLYSGGVISLKTAGTELVKIDSNGWDKAQPAILAS